MNILQNVSLKEKNWFKTGGEAKYYFEPSTKEDFQKALKFATEKSLPVFVLGLGANILIADEGFDGLVINTLGFKKISFSEANENNEVFVSAQAGCIVQDLIDTCLERDILGLEDFSGIPGTVGGSAYINIHYFDKLFSQFIVEGIVIEKSTGVIENVDLNWFGYGYDKSRLMEGNYLLLELKLKLKKTNEIESAYAKGRRDEIIRHRHMKYPYKNTCGSFFRNFLESEINFEINNRKILNVAYYLDKIGIKGELRAGNAIVSSKHANMIETMEGATSNDILSLAREMQRLVKDKFGVTPQCECQLIGCKIDL